MFTHSYLPTVLIVLIIFHHSQVISGRVMPYLTEDDLKHYVKDPSEVTDYTVFAPNVIHDERHRRSKVNSHATRLTFTAFEEDYQLHLIQAPRFFSPDLEVEHVYENGTIVKEPLLVDSDSFFHGYVVSHNASDVAISIYDERIRGIFSSEDGSTVFITPLNQEHAHEYARRFKRSPHEMHLIYKRDIYDLPRKCYIIDPPDDLPQQVLPLMNPANLADSFVPPKYLEINLILDVDYASSNTDHILLATTILNAASRRFSDASLGLSIRLYVISMIVLTSDTNSISGASFTIEPGANTEGTLDNLRQWSRVVNNQDDADPDHWDNIVILTGKDIVFTGDSATVGLASGVGTCTDQSGVSVTEDLGLASAFVLSHEIGHTLTLLHDEDEGCQPGFIMGASLSNGPNSFQWSSCSRDHLIGFLRWQRPFAPSSCMDDVPTGFNPLPTLQLAGQTYSLNQQCAFMDAGTVPCGTVECSNLKCRPASNPNVCTSLFFNIAEGTQCGANMICLAGDCVLANTVPIPVNGGWSAWTETACSRTCSGGVTIRQRVCNNPAPIWGGAPCVGEGVEFRLCNLASCSNSPDDFRDEQCAATSSIPFFDDNLVYDWTQFFAMGLVTFMDYCNNPCLRSDGQFFTLRPPGVNEDGTSCWDYNVQDTNKLLRCVGGSCETFGCDGLHESGQVFDACRVCNGDGTSCVITELNVAQSTGVSNLNIPAGATSILITNHGASQGNTVSIRTATGTQLLFGGTDTLGTTSRAFLGNFVMVGENNQVSGVQTFRSPGPIPEGLAIEVSFIATSNLDVEYYTQTAAIFFWNESPWSACSATCDGIETRVVTCIEQENGVQVTVADTVCEGAVGPKPDTTRPCLVGVCAQWVTGDLGQCNANCGQGIQTRTVDCELNNVPVADTLCNPVTRPPATMLCNVGSCNWITGAFGTCSVTCGSGIQTRSVTCINGLGIAVANSNCPTPMPAVTRICIPGPCNSPQWFAGPFGDCNANCGQGMQTRTVSCVLNNVPVADTMCNPVTRPPATQLCNVGSCNWITGAFGTCSITCGSGIQTRSVTCFNGLGITVANSNCPTPMPADTRICNPGPCNSPQWFAGPFGDCSTKCGKGMQRRLVECRIGNLVADDIECERLKMPHRKQVCISLRCLLGNDCELLDNPFIRRGL
ncbi:A disintegrin and metalloproteinase with thrombospondin motifs 9-like isoform X2 [Apostichopus japonicus]|uniref:A disintegrin and metalloproteinase with thrombospondin motifs 9-like isoform X2 n=1 Tax=Stichopus japonicus TaxID=307972 RepID=UPI003AB82C38